MLNKEPNDAVSDTSKAASSIVAGKKNDAFFIEKHMVGKWW
jgi:hypothetical protein